jgi:hypothetical protein
MVDSFGDWAKSGAFLFAIFCLRLPHHGHRQEKQAETAKQNKRFHTRWVFPSAAQLKKN